MHNWMYGFEHGPRGEITGKAHRAATVPRARSMAKHACQLAPELSKCWTTMSAAHLLDFEWRVAQRLAYHAVLGGTRRSPWAWLSTVQIALLDLEGATRSMAVVVALDPASIGRVAPLLYMKRDFAALRH
jgi:hypothetical protein